MLIKKEFADLPLLSPPDVPEGEEKRYGRLSYLAAAKVFELQRSGKVLVADMYHRRNKKFLMRFVSDGKNFVTCTEYPAEKWRHTAVCTWNGYRYSAEFYSTKDADLLAKEFFESQSSWSRNLVGYIDDFISDINYTTRARRAAAEAELREKHYAMYPAYPDNIETWCDDHLFKEGYIFFSKKDVRGIRKARCGVCEHEFEPRHDIKHNARGVCPKCGRVSKYKAEWIHKTISDEKNLCIAARVDGNLLLRWTRVERNFDHINHKKRFAFRDHNYNLHISTPKGITVYSYCRNACGSDRRRNGEICATEAMVYSENLDAVFGERYHGISMREVAERFDEKIRFGSFVYNLDAYPQMEYLLKLGLTALANNISLLIPNEKTQSRGFSALLGVNKQLLPVYQAMNVTYWEHRLIRAYGKWVSEEQVERMRMLGIGERRIDACEAVLGKMTMEKFLNYFEKQKRLNPDRDSGQLVTEYRDYIQMCAVLRVDLSHKAVRYPADLVAAHNRAVSLSNQLDNKNLAIDNAFAKAVDPIYRQIGFTEYLGESFMVVFPKVRSDLVAEGQSLHHCVGTAEQYYKNHMDGMKMIFFIRRVSSPDKPFFTMELDMQTFEIQQLHGIANCAAPKEVKKFAKTFVEQLRKSKKKGMKAA